MSRIKIVKELKLFVVLSNVSGIFCPKVYLNASDQNIRYGFVSSDRVSFSGVPGSSPPSSDVKNK